MEEHYEFDKVTTLSVVAMGVPGKRTFFLMVGEKEKWVRVWLEKEHLETLALAIDQFLLALSKEHHGLSREAEEMPLSDDVSSKLPSAELEIDQITLDFDKEEAKLNFLVHGVGPQRVDQVVVYCRMTLAQIKKFGDEARSICAAGRPRCVLCGRPIDPTGHTCPESN